MNAFENRYILILFLCVFLTLLSHMVSSFFLTLFLFLFLFSFFLFFSSIHTHTHTSHNSRIHSNSTIFNISVAWTNTMTLALVSLWPRLVCCRTDCQENSLKHGVQNRTYA